MRRQQPLPEPPAGDLGLAAVERVYRAMQVDAEWSLREERGFTWWGAWLRQRVWAGEAVASRGETVWQVRARTPVLRDQPDEPATYAFVDHLNRVPGTSAYVFDPADGTISARCGTFLYDDVAGWLGTYLTTAVALQASLAWGRIPALAGGRLLDDAPHPEAGRRRDPDDMLNLAGDLPKVDGPFHRAFLRRAAGILAGEGLPATFDEENAVIAAFLPAGAGWTVGWGFGVEVDPLLGPGALVRLAVAHHGSAARLACLANALNLAEAADLEAADDVRPHALGAWTAAGPGVVHGLFLPAVLFGDLESDDALAVIRNLLAWAGVRTRFATARLPWLEVAAAARFPDEPATAGADGAADGAADEDEAADGDDGTADDDDAERNIPARERSFGPAARTPRARPPAPLPARPPRELVVDPADPAAFAEIDDAVAVAEDGDRVVVRRGTYGRPVVVDRAVEIVGDGPRETILLEPVGGEALGIAASGTRVAGLTIRPSRAGNDGADHSALAVHDAAVTVEGCSLTSHLGATVWIGGPSAHVVLRGCDMAGGAQNAVWVTEEARAEMEACRVTGHRWPVTAGGEHAWLAVRDCEIVDNLDGGVVSMGRATIVIEQTTIARNAGSGVILGEPAPASRVEGCTIEANADFGVLVGAGRGATVVRNRIVDNGVGIVVVDGATPRVEGNELAGNATGIGVRGEGSNPVVIGNTISGGRGAGVVIDEAAAGRFEGNTVAGTGGAGVWVDDHGTAPSFTGNHVSTSALAGILVTDGGGGEFRSNDLRGNAAGSWKLDRPGDLRRDGNLEDAGSARSGASRRPPARPAPGGHRVH